MAQLDVKFTHNTGYWNIQFDSWSNLLCSPFNNKMTSIATYNVYWNYAVLKTVTLGVHLSQQIISYLHLKLANNQLRHLNKIVKGAIKNMPLKLFSLNGSISHIGIYLLANMVPGFTLIKDYVMWSSSTPQRMFTLMRTMAGRLVVHNH